jgi:hypothetical protein
MRKNSSFAIAATMLGLAMLFWAKSSVVATSADLLRPQAGMPNVAMAGLFLSVKALEPLW